MNAARDSRFPRARRLAATIALGAALPASAHEQGYGFVWANDPNSPSYTPDSNWTYNDAGNRPPLVTRTGTGEYKVTFPGLTALGAPSSNVQVTAYGSTADYCKVTGWSGDKVFVACFDTAGNPIDTRYSVLYLSDVHENHYAFALADQSGNPSYAPDPARSYNAGGGAITATRIATGTYAMNWDGISAIGSGGGHIQVTAYGPGNARCVSDGWSSETAYVLCYDTNGALVDSGHSILYWRPDFFDDGLAFAWADQPTSASYTPSTSYSYSDGGGPITATRASTGVYAIEWIGMDSVGINGGNVQVTAYGSSDARCKVSGWTPSTVTVRCHDTAGNPVDAHYNALFVKPPKKVWTQEYAFAWADQPSATFYTPAPYYSYNQLGGDIQISRSSPGVYTVFFDSFDAYPDGGNVQVTAYAMSGEYCKVASWGSDSVDVRCFGASGNATDSMFNVFFLKTPSQPDGVAYAWANDPGAASYTPSPSYSYNPSGGPITATRASVGVYRMTWSGFDPPDLLLRPHAQVTAYDSSNKRCALADWGFDFVGVRCFDAAGNPADSKYSVLFLAPDYNDDGLAFAMGDDLLSGSYSPDFPRRFNSGEGAVVGNNFSPGVDRMSFGGFSLHGLAGGHVLVSAVALLTATDTRCAISSWDSESVDLNCHDAAGAPAHAYYNVLFLRPVALPEPGHAAQLASGVALLGLLARRRSRLGRALRAATGSP